MKKIALYLCGDQGQVDYDIRGRLVEFTVPERQPNGAFKTTATVHVPASLNPKR